MNSQQVMLPPAILPHQRDPDVGCLPVPPHVVPLQAAPTKSRKSTSEGDYTLTSWYQIFIKTERLIGCKAGGGGDTLTRPVQFALLVQGQETCTVLLIVASC